MSQAVQVQINGGAVSQDNPLPVVVVSGGGGSAGGTTPQAKITYARFTSAAGAQTLSIAAGALEVSLANTGTLTASFTTTSMGGATASLKPVTDPDGSTLDLAAPSGYVLEAMSVTAPVGGTIDYMIIRP